MAFARFMRPFGRRGTIASYDYGETVRVQTPDKPEGFEVPSDERKAPQQTEDYVGRRPTYTIGEMSEQDLPAAQPARARESCCRLGHFLVENDLPGDPDFHAVPRSRLSLDASAANGGISQDAGVRHSAESAGSPDPTLKTHSFG